MSTLIETVGSGQKIPSDIPTRETIRFFTTHIPLGAEILEIGCGEGQVAFELLSRGYRLTGLDSDPELVARAQKRGARALVASWPEFDSPPVDVVAFTRSLHHISPLREAVARARELIRPTGLLLIEDFAFGEANETTIAWFLKALRSKRGLALINPVVDQLVTDLLDSKEPMAVWHRNHDHDLHSITAMSRAVAERFVIREIELVPYLYRYLVPVVAEIPEGAAFVEEVLQAEARLGKQGDVVLLGRRIVASPPKASVR
jgi:SAM-dependent methyltransferase